MQSFYNNNVYTCLYQKRTINLENPSKTLNTILKFILPLIQKILNQKHNNGKTLISKRAKILQTKPKYTLPSAQTKEQKNRKSGKINQKLKPKK